MIIVKLMGGLGNQMFQYALGRSLSARYETDLLLDTGEYDRTNHRVYALDKFAISAGIATPIQIKKCKHVVERGVEFDPAVCTVGPDAYLEGYWQSEKYFKDSGAAIRREFILKEPQGRKYNDALTDIASNASVSLHIRRGDYLSAKNQVIYTQLPLSYYEQAVACIAKKVGSIKIFVFSDDSAWVRENLSLPFPVVYVSDDQFADYQDLVLMSACKHHVIANSSFSWWGAWLSGDTPDRITIAPAIWLNGNTYHTEDIVPERWIKI